MHAASALTAMTRSAGTAAPFNCMIMHSDFRTLTVSNVFDSVVVGNMAEYAAKATPYLHAFSSKRAGFGRCSNSGIRLEQVDSNVRNSPKRSLAGWVENGDNWVGSSWKR